MDVEEIDEVEKANFLFNNKTYVDAFLLKWGLEEYAS